MFKSISKKAEHKNRAKKERKHSIISSIVSPFKQLTGKASNKIKQSAGKATDKIKQFAGKATDKIKQFAGKASGKVKRVYSYTVARVTTWVLLMLTAFQQYGYAISLGEGSAFFTEAINCLKILVIAIGIGLGGWGIVNLMEGYGNDNPGAKSQGIKQVMAGAGIAVVGAVLIPKISELFT